MISSALYSSKSDNWTTPRGFYQKLNQEFNFDDFDPCPLTADFNGLEIPWTKRVFVNPPYSNIKAFLIKAKHEIELGNSDLIVFLAASRTDTSWFHDYVYGKAELRFIRGRLKFGDSKNTAPFPSLIAIFKKKMKDLFIDGCLTAVVQSDIIHTTQNGRTQTQLIVEDRTRQITLTILFQTIVNVTLEEPLTIVDEGFPMCSVEKSYKYFGNIVSVSYQHIQQNNNFKSSNITNNTTLSEVVMLQKNINKLVQVLNKRSYGGKANVIQLYNSSFGSADALEATLIEAERQGVIRIDKDIYSVVTLIAKPIYTWEDFLKDSTDPSISDEELAARRASILTKTATVPQQTLSLKDNVQTTI
jgi:site-specific DNA-methyltransferase (adenine-specific)